MKELEERVKLWTPPDPDHPGNFDWMKRDLETCGNYFAFPSGYFGLYERVYGIMSIPEMFIAMGGSPKLFEELLEKITDYKIEIAKRVIKLNFTAGKHNSPCGNHHFRTGKRGKTVIPGV